MDRMAILAKTQKRHEGKRGGVCATTPLLRERVKSMLEKLQGNTSSFQ